MRSRYVKLAVWLFLTGLTLAVVGGIGVLLAGCDASRQENDRRTSMSSPTSSPVTAAPPGTREAEVTRRSQHHRRTSVGRNTVTVAERYAAAYYTRSWKDSDQFAYIRRLQRWITPRYAAELQTRLRHGNNSTVGWNAYRAGRSVTTVTPRAAAINPEAPHSDAAVCVTLSAHLVTTRPGKPTAVADRPVVVYLQRLRGQWFVDHHDRAGG